MIYLGIVSGLILGVMAERFWQTWCAYDEVSDE